MVKDIVEKVKKIILKPAEFFKDAKKETGYKTALSYFAILSLLSTILSVIVFFLSNGGTPGTSSQAFLGPSLVIGYIINLGITFVFAAILHLWIKLFKGIGKFEKTYQLYIYSQTLKLVIGWIPIANLLGWFYSFYILIIGTQEFHKIPKKKATLMFLIPGILLTILGVVVSYVAFRYLGSVPKA